MSVCKLDRWQWAFLVVLLAVFFIVQYPPLGNLQPDDLSTSLEVMTRSISGGDIKRQAAFVLLGMFGVTTFFDRKAIPLQINGILGWMVLFYMGWISLSVVWAQDFMLTFRRVMIFALLCMGVVAVVKRFHFEDMIRFTFNSTSIYLLVSIMLEIKQGMFQPLSDTYRFAGIFHSNYQGLNCALLLLAAVYLAGSVKRGALMYHVAALTGFIFLFLTKSRASLGSVICALLLYWFLVLSGSQKWKLAFFAGWAGSLIFLLFSDTLIARSLNIFSLGRNTADINTLTGRIPLWEECLKFISERPFFGYGYQGFWTPQHVDAISYRIGWPPYASHSVYIDLMLTLGIIGMLSYVMIYCVALVRTHRDFRGSGNTVYAFIFALLFFCLLDGVLETTLLNPNQLSFLSMVALASLAFSTPFAGRMRLHE